MSQGFPFNLRLHESVFKHKEKDMPVTIETAILKANKPIDFIEGEGFRTWYEDCNYPVNGFTAINEAVAMTSGDKVKKIIKWWLLVLSAKPVRYFVPLIFLLPRKTFSRLATVWIRGFMDFSYHEMKQYFWLDKYYSRAVREIRNGVMACQDGLTEEMDLLTVERIADVVATILQNDIPYRYRLQDILCLLDKDKLKENPSKELKRLFTILSERDKERKWKEMGTLVYWLVRIRPEIREIAVKFGMGMDTERLKLDINDKYHSYISIDYDFDGLNGEQRAHKWKEIHDAGQ